VRSGLAGRGASEDVGQFVLGADRDESLQRVHSGDMCLYRLGIRTPRRGAMAASVMFRQSDLIGQDFGFLNHPQRGQSRPRQIDLSAGRTI